MKDVKLESDFPVQSGTRGAWIQRRAAGRVLRFCILL